MQKNHTDRIGSVPVIIPLVNEPKNLPVFGAKVFRHAPRNSGTIIMPPGIFSTLRLDVHGGLLGVRAAIYGAPRMTCIRMVYDVIRSMGCRIDLDQARWQSCR